MNTFRNIKSPGFFLSLLFLFSACQKAGSAVAHPLTDSTQVKIPFELGLKHSLPSVLKESSGLCYTDGNLWTFGDSGNPNEIFKIDSSTGEILQTVVIQNFPNVDWEDITADSQFIFIGDFGNNDGNRRDLTIIRIRKSDLNDTSSLIYLNGEAIHFNYLDQVDFTSTSNTNFDCESVIAFGDGLYIFTKDGIDLQTRCYKLPKLPGNYTVSPVSTFNTKGKITGAAYNSETKEIALLGYMNKKIESFIWFLNGYSGDDFFSGSQLRINIGTEKDWQTEGIDYINNNRFFISNESSTNQPAALYYLQRN